MRVLVLGGPNFQGGFGEQIVLDALHRQYRFGQVVLGASRWDPFVHDWARSRGVAIARFDPEMGPAAGPLPEARVAARIAAHADALVVFGVHQPGLIRAAQAIGIKIIWAPSPRRDEL